MGKPKKEMPPDGWAHLNRVSLNRRNRELKATAFKEVEPVEFLIESVRSPRYQLIAWISYYTAQRANACCWLEHRDLNSYVTFRKAHAKTKKPHKVQYHPKLKEKIQFCLDERSIPLTGYLFPARTGSKREVLSTSGYDKAIARAVDTLIASGHPEYKGCSTHTFRRSRLQYLYYTQGWTFTQIQVISGHKSLASLIEYLEPDIEEVSDMYMQTD
ncbi:MAG: site-specific integrase [Cyanothece sp. SIO1E1]|nr:site-specific integrase [Cyanothece sp. SIO1E1]